MKDIGRLQTSIWERIREAVKKGDGATMHTLSQIAEDMDRKYDEWVQRSGGNNGPRAGGAAPQQPTQPIRAHNGTGSLDVTGRSIYGFEFDGTKVQVGTWKELLIALTKVLRDKHSARFDTVAPGVRGHLPYFSANPNE